MTRFEHTHQPVHRIYPEEWTRLGGEGWELVAVDTGIAYFKRPAPCTST